MDATEFGRVFNGVSLFMKSNYDAEKYNWKAKVPPKGMSKPAIASLVNDPYEARILALSCSFHDITWWQLTKEHLKLKDDWIKRIENPSIAVREIHSKNHLSFEELIKDTTRGSPLQNYLISGEIHFVTFAYVVLVTHCTKHWETLYWKTQKEKLLKIVRGIDINTANILQFASLLRKGLQ